MGSDRPLSFSNIRDRRVHILEVKNPNPAPLNNFELLTQFPEAILDISSGEIPANYIVEAIENWDKQPLAVSGDVSDSQAVEPFASEEKTGLWRVIVDAVPPYGTVKIKLLSTNGLEGSVYAEEVAQTEKWKADGELMWLLQASYRFMSGIADTVEQIIVPLYFDRNHRLVRTFPPFRRPHDINWVQLRHSQGVRIPGILRTRGYFFAKGRNGFNYSSPFMLERTDLDVKVGLFGSPPEHPGIEVRFRSK